MPTCRPSPRTDTGSTARRSSSAPLARWTTPDPLAEKYYGSSPYAFCYNNPVNFVDPDGRQIQFFEMAAYSGSIPNYAYSMPIYDYETGDYSITGYYDEEGNLVGYGAARNGRLEYVMDDVDDINIFTSNLSLFGYAANCFYNNGTPSNGAIAMISGDFGYGLEQEWKSAATSVEYWVNLAGILISPFSSQKAEMNKLIEQSKRLYPKKANKIEYHYIDPQYMGESPTGKKVPSVGSYHQMITNEFRKYYPYGKGKLPASERQKIMQQVNSKYPLP